MFPTLVGSFCRIEEQAICVPCTFKRFQKWGTMEVATVVSWFFPFRVEKKCCTWRGSRFRNMIGFLGFWIFWAKSSLGKFDEDIFSTSYHPGTLNNHFLILILNGCFNWIMKQTSTYRKWVDFPRLLGDKKGYSFFGTWKSFVFVCRFLSMTKTLPGTLKANQIKPIPGTLKNNHFFNGMLGKTTIFFNVMIWNSSSKWSKHIFQY